MASCTVDEFVNGMVYNYTKVNTSKVVGWINPKTPVLDVTETVQEVYPGTRLALLTIHGDYTDKIKIMGPYDSKPDPLPVATIVSNWTSGGTTGQPYGTEWERQYCTADKKYYWVIYPSNLVIYKTTPPRCTAGDTKCINGDLYVCMTNSKLGIDAYALEVKNSSNCSHHNNNNSNGGTTLKYAKYILLGSIAAYVAYSMTSQ